jgi:hypothetical protein
VGNSSPVAPAVSLDCWGTCASCANDCVGQCPAGCNNNTLCTACDSSCRGTCSLCNNDESYGQCFQCTGVSSCSGLFNTADCSTGCTGTESGGACVGICTGTINGQCFGVCNQCNGPTIGLCDTCAGECLGECTSCTSTCSGQGTCSGEPFVSTCVSPCNPNSGATEASNIIVHIYALEQH